MSISIVALQRELKEILGVKSIEFDDRAGIFTCTCGRCAGMKVSGGTAQGLYEKGQLERLKLAHDTRIANAGWLVGRSHKFKQPPASVLRWLAVEAKVDVRDVYRLKVAKRTDGGGGEVALWLFCRNDNGSRYKNDDGQPARRSVKMICKQLPEWVDDEYGYPMEQYGDNKVLSGE